MMKSSHHLRSAPSECVWLQLMAVGLLQVGDKLPKVTLYEGAPDKKVISGLRRTMLHDEGCYDHERRT